MTKLSVNIDLTELKSEIKSNLSALGKRRKDGQGAGLFGTITTSSAEDSLLDGYIQKGIELFVGEMSPLVKIKTPLEVNNVRVLFNSIRINTAKATAFELNLKRFVADYVLMKALELSGASTERQEAEADLQKHLNAAVKLVFTPDAPASSGKSLADMKGEVVLDSNENVLIKNDMMV